MATINKDPKNQNLIEETLSVLFNLGYKEKNNDDFIVEILGENTDEISNLAQNFNKRIHSLAKEEVDIAAPITMIVTRVHPDSTLDLKKPEGIDLPEYLKNSPWTNVKNPTIFQHLEEGDEVLVGHYSNGNKSNCWVMFAKLSEEEFRKKTIYKEIDKVYDLNDNVTLLKKWTENLILQAFPDVKIVDGDGNINWIPDQRRLDFQADMKNNWKEVKR